MLGSVSILAKTTPIKYNITIACVAYHTIGATVLMRKYLECIMKKYSLFYEHRAGDALRWGAENVEIHARR